MEGSATAAPMDFTWRDLVFGAFLAWATFMILLLGFFLVGMIAAPIQRFVADAPQHLGYDLGMGLYAVAMAGLLGGVVSILATVIGTPLVWLIGSALRQVRAIGVHLAVYALLGAIVGLIALGFLGWWRGDLLIAQPFGVYLVIASAIAVPAGWRWAMRRARKVARARATTA